MTVDPNEPAASPFRFMECLVMPMPTGKTAANLRELTQTLRDAEESVLRYHLWQSRLAIVHQVVEYPNDFAAWAATALQDSTLAEKLSSIDPFIYGDMDQMREALVDLLEEYMWDLPYMRMVSPGFEFYFCEESTVVLPSQIVARTLAEFGPALEKAGLDSIHYHFLDARWRLRSSKGDDFSNWIGSSYDLPELVSAIQGIDVWFYALEEIRDAVMDILNQYLGKSHGWAERI